MKTLLFFTILCLSNAVPHWGNPMVTNLLLERSINSTTTKHLSSTTTTTKHSSSTSHTTSKTTTTTTKKLTCTSSGYLTGKSGSCNNQNESDCCKSGTHYPIYTCSPPVSKNTSAILILNGFGSGEDGGGPSECDKKYHSNTELIVAMSTGWFNKMARCGKKVVIFGNGKNVTATVVDECDSRAGCDSEHDYQPPCDNNIVDASNAIWKALGVKTSDSRYGYMNVHWRDA